MSKKHLIEFEMAYSVLILHSISSSCVAKTRVTIENMPNVMIMAAKRLWQSAKWFDVDRSHSMSYRGRLGHIEGILGGSCDVAGGWKVVGMLYEHIAGCSMSFRAYDAMWTYHPPPYWNPDCSSQPIRVMCWSWGHVENPINEVQTSLFCILDFHSSLSNMSLLTELNAEVLNYVKSMPEHSVAEDSDFEVWGKEFCEKNGKCHTSMKNSWY